MSLTLNVVDHWSDGKRIHVTGTLIPSGSYTTGGDIIPFGNNAIKSSSAPIMVMITTLSPTGDVTYVYSYKAGTTRADQKLKIFTFAGVELPAGAYPGAAIANPAAFYAIFPKFI
jgi:hypothetical protein